MTLGKTQTNNDPLQRILVVAVACSPIRGSEGAMGWNRAVQSARFFDTVVVTEEGELSDEICDFLKANGPITNLRFVFVSNGYIGGFFRRFRITYYLSYYLWHRLAFNAIKRLHREQAFDLVHQATYCGFREPGIAWTMQIPFVWGPIGGTQDFPWRFLTSIGVKGAIGEASRTFFNQLQLRFGRARKAIRASSALLAANTSIQADCQKYFGVCPEVRLETGVNSVATSAKSSRDTNRPLRLLWSGELRPRKALHLLLYAIAQLPKQVEVELRILGKGPEKKRWMPLATRLGISSRTQFLGWLPRSEALDQLTWADVFVFTSLRDTSGTVVLEALSNGLPIICLDHQGVRDMVNDQCGIKVPVTTPKRVATNVAAAIEKLSKNAELYESLSAGALKRATEYLWDSHGIHMAEVYRRTIEFRNPSKQEFSD